MQRLHVVAGEIVLVNGSRDFDPGGMLMAPLVKVIGMFHFVARLRPFCGLFCLVGLAACQGTKHNNPAPVGETSGSETGGNETTGTGETGSTDTTGGSDCGELDCGLHGSCEETMDGPECACDLGYQALAGAGCEVDDECIRLRYLEDECRQLINDAPAVGLVFTIDACSGDPITPDKLADLGYELAFSENDNDFTQNADAHITAIDRPVESYVSIVLNVSDSITAGADVGTLITGLQALVAGLEPGQGEGEVYVQVFVFGRNVARYVDPTSDLAAVQQALQAIADDPAPAQALVNGNGTSTYGAVKRAIQGTTRARQLRSAVTNDGVLSVGSVLVLTDKDDSSGSTLDKGLIDGTIERVVVVGLGDGITDAEMQAIGRDGVFAAPDPDTWADVFEELGARVDAYPQATYMRAYCSGSLQGKPAVQVSLSGVEPTKKASCDFDANLFASMPPACNPDVFATDCDAKSCGGFTACGACGDSQCCAGTACTAPASASDCQDQDQLCNPSDEICVPDGNMAHSCIAPPAVGGDCVDLGGGYACAPGVSWCQLDDQDAEYLKCVAAQPYGDACATADQCESLHCAKLNPSNPNDPRICLEPAEIFDSCSVSDAVCENGSYCATQCGRRADPGDACGSDEECLSGNCVGNACASTGMCHWSWSEVAG